MNQTKPGNHQREALVNIRGDGLCKVEVKTRRKGREPKRKDPCRSDISRCRSQPPPGSLFTPPLRRPQTESLLKYPEVHETISRLRLENLLSTGIHHPPLSPDPCPSSPNSGLEPDLRRRHLRKRKPNSVFKSQEPQGATTKNQTEPTQLLSRTGNTTKPLAKSSSLSSGDGFSGRSRSSLPSSSPLLQRRSSPERESASSSPPSLSSVATAFRIGVDHLFHHHLHFSSVGVVHPRRVGVIISAVTQLHFCDFSDIISFFIISTSQASASFILSESVSSSLPSLSSVSAVIKGIRRHPPIGDFAYFGCKGIVSVFGTSLTIIHPGGELSTSTYPANIDELSCPPPATKKRSGRPPTKRKRSVGEFGVPGSKSQSHKCSRCGIGGHNKITCKRPIG
ncbi:hypothetical protein DY000_02039007 [Brassica cretica]|uniref:CCHC-type domain-containing protein n=1 Tax=Brassica cretica TaxID=69181 RepID=A0ABQ7BJ17_BRACR|nr:hypothetical protein DY000_02039007 [Brassica cretica]